MPQLLSTWDRRVRLSSVVVSFAGILAAAVSWTLPLQGQVEVEDDGILFAPDEDEPKAKAAPQPAAPPPAGALQGPPISAKPPQAEAPVGQEEAASRPYLVKAPPRIVPPVMPPDAIIGTYRVRVNMNKPNFNDGLKFYDKLYGETKWYPTLAADWFAWDWFVSMGLSLRAGYYVAEGHASRPSNKAIDSLSSSDIVRDEDGKTVLTLIPLQALMTISGTPFTGKWVMFDGWFGVEHLFHQEVRSSGGSTTSSRLSSLHAATASGSDSNDTALTNQGGKNNVVFGGSANILINALDQRTIASLRSALGLGAVYLSPFVEITRGMPGHKGVSFGRKTYGVGFTFESAH